MRIAVELEQAYIDGMKRAAALVEEKGQRELAVLVRRLAEGTTFETFKEVLGAHA